MTVSPLRSVAEAAEGNILQPSVLPPGPIITPSGQVVGFHVGGISPLAQSADVPTQHLPVAAAGHPKADDHPAGRCP